MIFVETIKDDVDRKRRIVNLIEEHGFIENKYMLLYFKEILIFGRHAKFEILLPNFYINQIDLYFCSSDNDTIWLSIPGVFSTNVSLEYIDKAIKTIDIFYPEYFEKKSRCSHHCFFSLSLDMVFRCKCNNIIDLNKY